MYMKKKIMSMGNQNKHSVLHWILLFVVPMAVVLLIMLFFSAGSNRNAKEEVADNVLRSTQNYTDSLRDELRMIAKMVGAVCNMLEQDQTLSDVQVAELLQIVEDCTEASRVELCDSEGYGIDQSGKSISIGEEKYFQEILISEKILLYVDENGNMPQRSIVIAERLSRNGGSYMLIFYPIEKFDGMLSRESPDPGVFLALLDEEGRVLSSSGEDSVMLRDGNFLEIVRACDPDAAARIRECIDNGSRGISSVQVGDESRVLVYVPLEMGQWGIVLGAEQEYVDGLVDHQWKDAKERLIWLIVVVAIYGCFGMVIDIIGRIRDNRQKKELEDKADTDLLTGLNNKLATERKIKNYMSQNPEVQSVMFLLDVDDFKTVNDTMGHAFGDEVLSSLGEGISSLFRASDIIGRVGGDEFMIFLKAVPTTEIIQKEAETVEEFFHRFQVGEKEKYDVRASIGVAVFPHDGADFETLYKAADQGLYKAKRRGKNQLAFYEDKRDGRN